MSGISIYHTTHGSSGISIYHILPSELEELWYWCGLFNVKELCSTPYGINGFGTTWGPVRVTALLECSTPYGINGFGTSPK
jgi:hypothetical protein